MTVAPGRILYAGFAAPRHSGGIHVLTQHVQLLRAAGHDAWLWLPGPGGRPGWIDEAVPTVVGPTAALAANDLLVVPETPVVPGLDPAPGGRVVIFNQNHFYTYAAADPVVDPAAAGAAPTTTGTDGVYPGWRRRPDVWVVSEESSAVLSAVLPELDVMLVPNPVDGSLFRPRPTDQRRVSWFPRKRPREASLLIRLLRADPRLAGVELCPMVNLTRSDVVEVMGTSTVFVSLGHSESFGLTVAEALASQCLVVGYDGGGGHELFAAPGALAVPEQRPLLLVDAVADLLARADQLLDTRVDRKSVV